MLLPALPVDLSESGLDVEAVRARAARGEPPASAEEYLMRVRLESEALPEIAEAEGVDPSRWEGRQTAYMPAQPPLPATPAGLEPSGGWASGVLRDFLDLRLGLAALEEEHGVGKDRRVKVPPLKEEGKWRRFFFGSSNNHPNSNSRRGVRARDAADAAAASAAGSGGRKRARLEGVGVGVPEEEQAQLLPLAAAAEEGEAGQGEFDDEEGEVVETVMEEGAGDDGGEKEEEVSTAAIAAIAVAVPVVGPMKEVFEGPHAPGTSLVLQFDQVCTVRLLGYHAQWLEASPRLGHEQGAWLFALLARLSQPLHPEAAALVRQLYRRCWTLRAGLPPLAQAAVLAPETSKTTTTSSSSSAMAAAAASGNKEGEGEERRRHLARLNTLLAITGTYFRQGEEETAAIAAMASAMALKGEERDDGVVAVAVGMEEEDDEEQEEEEGECVEEQQEEEEEGEIREGG